MICKFTKDTHAFLSTTDFDTVSPPELYAYVVLRRRTEECAANTAVEDKSCLVPVQCSVTQYDVADAGTACCIISMLNGLSVLRDPQQLTDWNEVWLEESMKLNMMLGGSEFKRLEEVDARIFTKSGYTSVDKVSRCRERGGLIGNIERMIDADGHEWYSCGCIEFTPKGMAGRLRTAREVFFQVSANGNSA